MVLDLAVGTLTAHIGVGLTARITALTQWTTFGVQLEFVGAQHSAEESSARFRVYKTKLFYLN